MVVSEKVSGIGFFEMSQMPDDFTDAVIDGIISQNTAQDIMKEFVVAGLIQSTGNIFH